MRTRIGRIGIYSPDRSLLSPLSLLLPITWTWPEIHRCIGDIKWILGVGWDFSREYPNYRRPGEVFWDRYDFESSPWLSLYAGLRLSCAVHNINDPFRLEVKDFRGNDEVSSRENSLDYRI